MDTTPTDNPAVILGRKRWAGVSAEDRRAHMADLAAKRSAQISAKRRLEIARKASKAAAKARAAKAKAEKSSRRKSNDGKAVTTQSEK